jgi:hypothetical protein
MRVSAQVKSNALEARAFLDHDADGVNGFLIQASVAMQDPCAQALFSMAPTCDNSATTLRSFEGRRRSAQDARRLVR